MQTALSSKRSWIARIAVLAMVASLMAIAAPAGAAIDTSDSCPDAIPSAGFTDLAGVPAAAVDAIDCIAFYEISTGTSATTFDPFADVERWQMALFLTRQAEIHGVTLPDGSDQGFTDLAGVPAAAVTAINQLAQLGISTGTSATTFDPFADVERWQMALFLTRLITGAGLTLAPGADQGFVDLAGVPDAAVTAINQLGEMDLADGTSATTFDPFSDVERWAMALFLTRVLAADGITPSGLAAVTVTPATQATQANGTARLYTADVEDTDGSNYTGQVIIRLLDATSAGAANGTTAATGVHIEAIDGVAIAGMTTTQTRFLGSDGQVTFLVRHQAGASADVIPQVIRDSDTDGVVDSAEERGLGGATFFTFTPAEIGDTADTGNLLVCSTDKAANWFAYDTNNGVCGDAGDVLNRLQYDDNDVYLGAATTFAEFEADLSVGDTVRAQPYENDDADQSTFTLVTDVITPLAVTSPSAAVTVDADTRTVSGTGNPGWEVVIYRDQNVADTYEPATDPAVTGVVTVGPDGSWSTSVSLTQSAANNFIAVQRSAGSSTTSNASGGNAVGNDNVANVPTITESTNAGTLITSTVAANVGASALGTLSPSDTITITIDDTYSGVGSGDTITVVDVDGSTAVLTLGTDVSFNAGVNGTATLTLTLIAIPTTTGGTAGIQSQAQITAVTGFTDSDGAAINIAGSGANRVFTGF